MIKTYLMMRIDLNKLSSILQQNLSKIQIKDIYV